MGTSDNRVAIYPGVGGAVQPFIAANSVILTLNLADPTLRELMDLSIVVPAFNESRKITETLHAITSFLDGRPWQCEIIVVDDGSDDGTAAIVGEASREDQRIRCLCNERNRGKGYSIRNGLSHSHGDVVGFIDADNKTEIGALDQVLKQFCNSGVDGVLGDRTLVGTDIAQARRAYRQWGSEIFRYMLRFCVGLSGFPDTQCGFKFFRRPVARDLFKRQFVDGYMFDVEILLLAVRSGYNLVRIPIIWRDDPDSRFKPITGMLENLGELYRIRRGSGPSR